MAIAWICEQIPTCFSQFQNSIAIQKKIINSQLEIKFEQMETVEPADWNQAKLHAQAMAPGMVNSQAAPQVCRCCHQQIYKDEIPMCENIKQLAILGPGFPLYFIFLKYSIIMIFLLTISYSALTLYWAYTNNYDFCINKIFRYNKNNQHVKCTGWMVLLSRLEYDVDANENILRITSFLTQLFFLIYIRDLLRKHNAYFHERQDPKISDYSVMVKNIPKQKQIKAKIKVLFEKCLSRKYRIEAIRPIAYLDDEYKTNFEQIQSYKKKFLLLNAKYEITENDQAQIEKIKGRINELTISDRLRQDIYSQAVQNDELECQKCIVILNTEKEKQLVLTEKINSELAKGVFGELSHRIVISPAPQPNEIILSNINIPKSSKIKRIILGWAMFVVLLATVTGVFYILLTLKAKEIEHSLQIYASDPIASADYQRLAFIIVLLTMTLIVIFNKFLLAAILHKITSLEKHKTSSGFELSFSIKYALGLVFTTAILTLLVENIRLHNIYEHDYGVIEEETIMYFFAAFFVPFVWFINPWYLWKCLKINIFENYPFMTQSQANLTMELPEYNIGKRYAEIIEMVWFTYFYASLIPIGAPLALIGASLFYWVDKYNLLRKSSVKQNVSGEFSMKALVMLDLTLILKPVGQIVFDMQIRDKWNFQSLILIVIGAIYVLIPKEQILDWVNGEKFILNRESYKEIKKNSNLKMYSNLNPQRISDKDRLKFESTSSKKKQKCVEGDFPTQHILFEGMLAVSTKDQCPQQVS